MADKYHYKAHFKDVKPHMVKVSTVDVYTKDGTKIELGKKAIARINRRLKA